MLISIPSLSRNNTLLVDDGFNKFVGVMFNKTGLK